MTQCVKSLLHKHHHQNSQSNNPWKTSTVPFICNLNISLVKREAYIGKSLEAYGLVLCVHNSEPFLKKCKRKWLNINFVHKHHMWTMENICLPIHTHTHMYTYKYTHVAERMRISHTQKSTPVTYIHTTHTHRHTHAHYHIYRHVSKHTSKRTCKCTIYTHWYSIYNK